MNQNAVKQFFDVWSIYDEVLARNYMFHAEIFAEVRAGIVGRFDARPFSILDLGCGSARHIAQALRGSGVVRYVGVDLSDAALAHAGKNLESLGCEIGLRQTDLLSGLEDTAEEFDAIISSYAVHHLCNADKQLLFDRVHRRLTKNGVFLLIDMSREEAEETAVCLAHYCDWIESKWITLPAPAKELVIDHISKNDFPETSTNLYSMAKRAGFAQSREVCRFLWHRMWEFSKNALSK